MLQNFGSAEGGLLKSAEFLFVTKLLVEISKETLHIILMGILLFARRMIIRKIGNDVAQGLFGELSL